MKRVLLGGMEFKRGDQTRRPIVYANDHCPVCDDGFQTGDGVVGHKGPEIDGNHQLILHPVHERCAGKADWQKPLIIADCWDCGLGVKYYSMPLVQ